MNWKASVATLAVLTLSASIATAGTLSGTATATGQRNSGGAVVYIDTIEGQSFSPPAEPVVMNQKAKAFEPGRLPVLVGTQVEFLNSDPFSHNVFSPDPCPEPFDLGSWPTGESRPFTFSETCVAVILCSVHPEMDAFVIAVPTPYWAVTAEDGSYRIEDVPDGDYTVVVWHDRFKKDHSETISIAGDTVADFTLKR